MKLSNKNKLIILALSTIGLCYFCYVWAISKTVANYQEIGKVKEYLAKNGPYKNQLQKLQSEYNRYTSNGVIDNDKNKISQDKLFQFISSYILEKNMRINQVPQTMKSNIEGYDVETNLYKIQGDFQQLISLVYEVEHVNRLAKVSSLQIKKQFDRKTKLEYIEASIYLQNIK